MSEILTHEQHVALVEDLVCCAEQDIRDDMDDSSIATQTRKALVLAQFAALRSALAAAGRERDSWTESARMYARNADYYRGLIDDALKNDPAAYVADDGSISEGVLRAKLPELYRAVSSERDSLRTERDDAIRLLRLACQDLTGTLVAEQSSSLADIALAIEAACSRLAEMDHLGTGAARSAG